MHFYLLLRPFISSLAIIAVINVFISSALSQSIPQVRSESQSPIVRPVGANVHIQCPVYDDGSGLLFYEWTTEKGEAIDSYSSSRIKFNDRGILKIKSAVVSDSGVYHCKAINGFGSVVTSVVLKIVPSEDLKSSPPLDNQYPINYPREDNYLVLETNRDGHFEQVISTPVMIEKEVGSFVVLKCSPVTETKGHWYKNGNRMHQKRKDSVTLRNLKVEDSGSYSCVSKNGLQEANNTYVLRVFDNNLKPELKEFTPINSTVLLGDKAVFHCKVYSEVKPQIQWLKSYTEVRDRNEAIQLGLLDSQSFPGLHLTEKYYQVLKSGKVVDDGKGIYYNNLIINKTTMADSGSYVCMVATTLQGNINIIHKSTYLKVRQLPEDQGSHLSSWNPIWVVSSFVFFILFVFVTALLCQYCLKNRYRNESKDQNNIERQIEDIDHNRNHQRNYYFPESVHSSCYNYGSETIHLNTECSDYMSSSERGSYPRGMSPIL